VIVAVTIALTLLAFLSYGGFIYKVNRIQKENDNKLKKYKKTLEKYSKKINNTEIDLITGDQPVINAKAD